MKRLLNLWVARLMSLIMAIAVAIGVIAASQISKGYDERTYLLVLTIMALLLFFRMVDWDIEEEEKNRELKRQRLEKHQP